MTKLETVARQALEDLIVAEEFVDRHSEDWYISGQKDLKQIREAITALREALDHFRDATKLIAEQAEQEPVGEVFQEEYGLDVALKLPLPPAGTKLYAAPVRTKDLTDDEIHKCDRATVTRQDFARAVIAADREKNK